MPAITLITSNAASADALTGDDYRDIYAELRLPQPKVGGQADAPRGQRRSLRQFAALIGEPPSIAYWSKYEADSDMILSRMARNRLRCAVGLAELPPDVRAALADVDSDAAVWRIGDDSAPARTVILLNASSPVDLHVNHTVTILEPPTDTPAPMGNAPYGGDVTGVTAPPRPALRRTRPRDRHSVTIPSSAVLRLDAARQPGESRSACLLRLLEAVLP